MFGLLPRKACFICTVYTFTQAAVRYKIRAPGDLPHGNPATRDVTGTFTLHIARLGATLLCEG